MNASHEQFAALFGTNAPACLAAWLERSDALTRAMTTYGAELPTSVRAADHLGLPGCRADQVWLVTENQGVCIWLSDAATGSPILVAAEHLPQPVKYADNLTSLIDGWLWDGALLGREPLLQAQAPEGDDTSLSLLAELELLGTTYGWPRDVNERYRSGDGLEVLVWRGTGQWDWMISAEDAGVVEHWLPRLREVLGEHLWSNDEAGIRLLG